MKILAACTALLCFFAGPVAAQSGGATTACCSSISDIQFRGIPPGEEIEFSLTAEAPVFTYLGHARPFIALKLPDGFIGTTLQVRMFLSTGFLTAASVVIPEFIYLNGELKIVETQTTSGFQEAGGFWRTAVLGRAEVPPDARYVVVIAGDGGAGRPVYNVGGGRAHAIAPAAEGNFTLRLFGQPATTGN